MGNCNSKDIEKASEFIFNLADVISKKETGSSEDYLRGLLKLSLEAITNHDMRKKHKHHLMALILAELNEEEKK